MDDLPRREGGPTRRRLHLMISRQTRAVIVSAVFFMGLAAFVLYQPAPDLVPSATLLESLEDADHQVARGKAQTASKALDVLGRDLASWSSDGEGLSDSQRSDLSLLARDARMMSATLSGRGLELEDGDAAAWVDLQRRIQATFAGD